MSYFQIKNRWTDAVIYEGEAATLGDLVGTAVKNKINLGDANLGDAYHIFSFSGIGSARRMTTYWLEADKIWCGCFNGTMQEFIDQVEETHGQTSRHALEYKSGIDFLNNCVAQIPSDEIEAGKKYYAEMMATLCKKADLTPKEKATLDRIFEANV